MNINFESLNELEIQKSKLKLDEIVFIGYVNHLSLENESNEFMYSYSDIFDNLPLVFNCKTLNGNYKKVKRILDNENVSRFIDRSNRRAGQKGTEVYFKINRNEINKLGMDNMFLGD